MVRLVNLNVCLVLVILRMVVGMILLLFGLINLVVIGRICGVLLFCFGVCGVVCVNVRCRVLLFYFFCRVRCGVFVCVY